jgi:hypothetical protein
VQGFAPMANEFLGIDVSQLVILKDHAEENTSKQYHDNRQSI